MKLFPSLLRPAAFIGLVLICPGGVDAQTGKAPGAGQGVGPQSGKAPGAAQGVGPANIHQTPWFNNPQLQQQLKFNNEQTASFNKAYQEAWTNYNKGVTGIDKNLSPAEQQQRTDELQQNFHNNFRIAANKLLSDPAQRERYNQLYHQYRVYDTFNDPAISKRLNISDAQRQQLNHFQQSWSSQMGKLQSLYQTNPQEATTQFNKLQAQNGVNLNSVLTPEQQTAWRHMTGEPYSFPAGVYFDSTNKNSEK